MNKMVLFVFTISLLTLAACRSTAPVASTANTPITLDEALQKSAETRQKIHDAKQQYEAIKPAAGASAKPNQSQAAKAAVKAKLDASKQKIELEKQAWQEILE